MYSKFSINPLRTVNATCILYHTIQLLRHTNYKRIFLDPFVSLLLQISLLNKYEQNLVCKLYKVVTIDRSIYH